ncbi:MAG: shikimate dehydrogenase [Pseudomonadales bacterium]|nr:shikimate dehydrogenase [Pseudomonadales bacterium]
MKTRLQVVGDPVGHSLSPDIHQLFAAQLGDHVLYGAEAVPSGQFDQRADAFRRAGGKGMNVTVPHKAAAFAYVDLPSVEAQAAGAVNTIHFCDDGICRGYNTDGQGLVRDLVARWGVALDQARVIILGAGGAARGVVLPLFEAGVGSILIANRTLDKADTLCAELEMHLQAGAELRGAALTADLTNEAVDLVINATSAGLAGKQLILPVSSKQLRSTFCYDMSYGNNAVFHKQISPQAKQSVDGLGMLIEQAAFSYELWLGHRPDTNPVYDAILAKLAVKDDL